MGKWKAVRVKQELVDQAKKEVARSDCKSLSEFVSEAIQQRLQTLAKQRVPEYLERDRAPPAQALQGQVFYSPKHVWAQVTSKGQVRLGITEYFQGQLREIVNVRTYEVGEKVSRDSPFGVLESWWFTHDLYSPVDGEIIEVNKRIVEDPFMLMAAPSTWIVRVQPEEDSSWMKDLLNLQNYQKSLKANAA
ncbi:MAG: hypothetical protein JSV64_01015 [Candidatus Bathyarchaeota archaeon]|nr:MAG: hypothetical protein JSV64_01015 [Candidatus Bathyarchaeota archaeon]